MINHFCLFNHSDFLKKNCDANENLLDNMKKITYNEKLDLVNFILLS